MNVILFILRIYMLYFKLILLVLSDVA